MSIVKNYLKDIQMHQANEEDKNDQKAEIEEWVDRVIELDNIKQGFIVICSVVTKDFKSYMTGNKLKDNIKNIHEVMNDDI